MAIELHESDFADEQSTAKFLGVTVQTVRNWRNSQPPVGPSFLFLLGVPRYPIQALKEWGAAHYSHRTSKGWNKYQIPRTQPERCLDIFDARPGTGETNIMDRLMAKVDAKQGGTSAPHVESVNPVEKG